MDEQSLKDLLARENEEFLKVINDHQTCERELEALKRKFPVTEADALAERALKKRKLVLKDRMYQMMQDYEKTL